MTTVQLGGHATGLGTTQRTDRWWATPLAQGVAFALIMTYATWAAFQGKYYYAAPYISPLYAPVLYSDPAQPGAVPVDHTWFGVGALTSPPVAGVPAWWPAFLPFSPAFLILAFPGSFRLTCYYYRKFYYRSYFMRPPACAVGASFPGKYKGETALLIFQNLHRYTLYVAIAFLPILYYDAFLALVKDGQFGIGIGTVMLFGNATLLAAYTFGCHSWRHLIGGRKDCFSCDASSRTRYGLWKRSTWFNERHQEFAWASLFWVAATDAYIRLVSMGVITDLNTWGS